MANSNHKLFAISNLQGKNMRGFTLIETLIYSALLSLTIGLTLGAVYQLVEGSEDLREKVVREEEANFVMRKLSWALTGANTINTPASGATSTTLSVNKTGFAQNPIVFDLSGGSIRIQKAGGAASALSNSLVSVSGLLFEHVPASGNAPAAAKTSFTISPNTYQTTIYLRK